MGLVLRSAADSNPKREQGLALNPRSRFGLASAPTFGIPTESDIMAKLRDRGKAGAGEALQVCRNDPLIEREPKSGDINY